MKIRNQHHRESRATNPNQQSFSIGAVEYVIRGVVSVRCDGVGGILNAGNDKMGEEGQHGWRYATT